MRTPARSHTCLMVSASSSSVASRAKNSSSCETFFRLALISTKIDASDWIVSARTMTQGTQLIAGWAFAAARRC
jgi:hypothetical protein